MQKYRRPNKRKYLRFDLRNEESTEGSWRTYFTLGVSTVIFCCALLFAMDQNVAPAEGEVGSPSFGVEVNALKNIAPAINTYRQGAAELSVRTHSVKLAKCRRIRVNCVVDGDTLWLNGEKIRIADIDTPEIGRPHCRREYELGVRATQRLTQLLNEGEFSLVTTTEWGEEDRYGRKLRMIIRQGSSVGEQMVHEGLAHRWDGQKKSWC